MATTANPKSGQGAKPWWSDKRNRNKVWLGLLGAGLVAVVALFLSLRSGGGNGLDEASDDGSRFTSFYTFKTADPHALTFDPAQSGRMLFGHHGGVMASEDTGRSWTALVDRQNFDGMNLTFDPSEPRRLYLAGHNMFARSNDSGATWETVDHNLPGLDLHAFGASSREPGRLYAFALGRGIFVSAGGDANWQPLWTDAPQGTNSIVELNDGTLIVGATDRGILRSTDGGKTWGDSRAGIGTGAIFAVKGTPNGHLYAGTSNGLFTSKDGGESWTATSLDDVQVVAIGVNPTNPDEVMAIDGGGQLYRSTDGGSSWTS